jgi:hypothetical protein
MLFTEVDRSGADENRPYGFLPEHVKQYSADTLISSDCVHAGVPHESGILYILNPHHPQKHITLFASPENTPQ